MSKIGAYLLPLFVALSFLYPSGPAEAATKQITLDQFVYGRLALDSGTGQRFESYWLGHGGPKRINTKKHPIPTFDPLTCTYVAGTLCALAISSLDAATVADPGR